MDLVEIGKVIKPFGVKGHLKLDINEAYKSDLASSDVVFLALPDGKIPFFINEVKYDNPPTILFEDVDSKEAAAGLSMSLLYMKLEDVTVELDVDKGLEFDKLAGFKLFDKKELIGTIEAIEEYPSQIMAILDTTVGNVMIPLVEDFILELDVEKRVIYCDLPLGLVSSQTD